jgi:tetrahydromethanopterin S-methyltransferase subunit H
MMILHIQADENAEQVDGHKFEFTSVRTISFSTGSAVGICPTFAKHATKACFNVVSNSKYHRRMRLIVLSSHANSDVSSDMIFSITCREYRLYGTIKSGKTW